MNSSNAKVKHVAFARESLRVELVDGRVLGVPLSWYPTLMAATPRQLSNWKPCAAGAGIFWPALDYHLSVDGMLRGAREADGITRYALAPV